MAGMILQRVTTEYVETEDRIRLAGESEGEGAVVIWLTLRMLQRLLPVLVQGLEKRGSGLAHADILHSFEQQAAKADLSVQAPVCASTAKQEWMAHWVDISMPDEGASSMTFRGAEGEHERAVLALETKPLRQWLGIVYDAYCRAEWPTEVWPQWFKEAAQPVAAPAAHLH
jgi:hypothetical protein